MRVLRIDNPIEPERRTVIDVPPCDSAGALRETAFHGDPAWQFVRRGVAIDDACPLNDSDELLAVRAPEGPVAGFLVQALITAAISVGVGFLVQLLLPPSRPGQPQDESPTYRWDGIANLLTSGNPIPLIFGSHRVGGQVIQIWREGTSHNTQTGFDSWLNMLIAIGHGPLVGTGQNLRINDNPSGLYEEVTVTTRPGHDDQQPIDGFDKPIVAYEIDAEMTQDWRVYQTKGPIEKFDLLYSFPEGLFGIGNNGDVISGQISLEVEYRPAAGSGGWTHWDLWVNSPETKASASLPSDADGEITQPFGLMFTRSVTPGTGPAEIRVRRKYPVGEEPAVPNRDLRNRAHWDEVNEHQYHAPGTTFAGPRTYPGIALIAFRMKATEQLSGRVPTITSDNQGLRVPQWSGAGSADEPQLTYAASRNPAWIVAGILLNRRWGLGNWISHGNIDWAAMKDWADWCDANLNYFEEQPIPVFVTHSTESVSAGATNIVVVGSDADGFQVNHYVRIASEPLNVITGKTDLGGGRTQLGLLIPTNAAHGDGVRLARHELGDEIDEPRVRCDYVLDRQMPAWDFVQDVCRVGRAVPIRIGDKFSVRVDRAGEAVQTFSEASILTNANGKSTLEVTYLGSSERVDLQEIHFLDRTNDFLRGNQRTPGIPLSPNADPVIRTSSLFGVTRPSHARREAYYHQLRASLPRRRIRFQAALDGLAAEAGDLIRVGHMMLDWSVLTGRANGTLDSLTLDHELVLEPATTYKALVRLPGDQAPTEVTITAAAGTYAPGDTISTDGSSDALEDSPIIIGEENQYFKVWRVEQVTMTPDLRLEVAGIEYVPAVHALQGAPTDEGEPYQACDGSLTDPPGAPVAPGTYTLILRPSSCEPPAAECGLGWRALIDDITITPTGTGAGCVTVDSTDLDPEAGLGGGTAQITISSGCGGDPFCLHIDQTFKLICPAGGDPPAVESSDHSTADETKTHQFAFTVADVAERALFVGVAIAPDETIEEVTYDGVAMDLVHAVSHDGVKVAVYRMLAPPAGAANVAITTDSGGADVDLVIGATQVNSVSQLEPVAEFVTATGDDDEPGVSFPNPKGAIFAVVGAAGSPSVTGTAGATEQWNDGAGAPAALASAGTFRAADEETDVHVGWTLSQPGDWAAIGVVIRPADAAGPDCEQDYQVCYEHCSL